MVPFYFCEGIYSHSVDPLQVFPQPRTYTFHNADEDVIPSLTTTASISPYGLPYGASADSTPFSRICRSDIGANSGLHIGKTSAADSSWPFPSPIHTGGFFGAGAAPWTW